MAEIASEFILKDVLKEHGYLDNHDLVLEYRDNTKDVQLKKLLANASKKHTNNRGIPDFIIRSITHPSVVMLVEVKEHTSKHESTNRDKPDEYAVDGALWYSQFVSKKYDVISLAFSGTTIREMKATAFYQLKGTDDAIQIKAQQVLPFSEYLRILTDSEGIFRRDYESLLKYAKTINEELHDLKIKETQRALFISGVLVALQDDGFRSIYYDKYSSSPQTLISYLINAISIQLRADPDKNKNADVVLGAFDFIKKTSAFNNETDGALTLREEILHIQQNVYSFMDRYHFVDALSEFYIEFLRYANQDKGLGIVLTPPHITNLFAKMAGVDKDSVVLDNAAGTGGFLVAAMGEMINDAGDDAEKIHEITKNQIYGVEFDSDIYALLASNMIIHSDGRSHLEWGSTFDIVPNSLEHKDIRDNVIDVGLLNPPFKSSTRKESEFDFIFSNLSAVKKGGTVIALVPTSVVLANKGAGLTQKEELLKNHTLEAVVSLPEELFANSKTSTVTVGMVITAHIPHAQNKETWFGYWRDDHFVKTKSFGRTDINHTWKQTEEEWLSAFKNKKVIPQKSVMRHVEANDEWMAEAYLEPDYGQLTADDFEETARKFLLYTLDQEQNR